MRPPDDFITEVDSHENRKSFEAWLRPLRTEAYRIVNAVFEWISISVGIGRFLRS